MPALSNSVGNVPFSAATEYILGSVSLSDFPAGSKILLLGSFSMNKSSGTPAANITLKTNSATITSITTTRTYTASVYDGWSINGIFIKNNQTSASLSVVFDGALNGSGVGNIIALRVG